MTDNEHATHQSDEASQIPSKGKRPLSIILLLLVFLYCGVRNAFSFANDLSTPETVTLNSLLWSVASFFILWGLWRGSRAAYYCAEFLVNVVLVFGAFVAIGFFIVFPFSPDSIGVRLPSLGLYDEPIEITSWWGKLLATGVFLVCLRVVVWMSRELSRPHVKQLFFDEGED